LSLSTKVQADNVDIAVARELGAKGVPKSDIVRGFRCPSVRTEAIHSKSISRRVEGFDLLEIFRNDLIENVHNQS
jgi:XisI protein